MGYTSYKKETTKQEVLALIVGKELTEASNVEYFNMPKYKLAGMFPLVEIRDNGKYCLINGFDFAVFE